MSNALPATIRYTLRVPFTMSPSRFCKNTRFARSLTGRASGSPKFATEGITHLL